MTRPVQPPMPDERLDRLVRRILAERADDVAASAASADEMAERITTRLRPSPFGRRWMLLAAAMLTALLVGGALAVGGAVRLPALLLPDPLPSPARDGETVAPAPSAAPGDEVVHGWPDTNENAPGLYSWDGSRCSSTYCVIGFMHNGYGTGDVEIRIEDVSGRAYSDDGATTVTVAGHDGMYRRIDAQRERWVVDIEGTRIAIHLTARPGTSEDDLAEAHAIIDSMRTEADDNDLGFRLIFTLVTNDWDSG